MTEADFKIDFELEGEPYHTEPYLFEPEYTEEELRKRGAARAKQAVLQPAVVEYPKITKTEDVWWCTCSCYVPVAPKDEYVCCRV